MQNINWAELPYDHSGKWEKKYSSLFNDSKITFPQLVMEYVMSNREKYIKTHPKIVKGKDWHIPFTKQVRMLVQQAYCVCNYFPHPNDDPLVLVAFKNVLTSQRVWSIGTYKKVRKKGQALTITDAEKTFVKMVHYEYNKLRASQEKHSTAILDVKMPEAQRKTTSTNNKKGGLSHLLELE